MDNLTELYCLMDDFCKSYEAQMQQACISDGRSRRRRQAGLSLSEMMTLVVLFHQLRYRQFKAFYLCHVCMYMRREFPRLPSYQRCIELMPRCAHALAALLETLKGQCTGISIIDSTPLVVCDNLRIHQHRVFKGLANRGKSSTGWFFGFKLHVVINHLGQLLGVRLTSGNVNDRKPVPDLVRSCFGKLFGDKGYLSKQLTTQLKSRGLELITKVRKNMKPIQYTPIDRAILKRRSLIETVFDQLKNLCQIEHSRHRSVNNFVVNLLSGLVAYCLMPNKPKLARALNQPQQNALVIPN